MLKHSVTDRMVGTFAIILFRKHWVFRKMLIVLRLENQEGVMTVSKEEEKASPATN